MIRIVLCSQFASSVLSPAGTDSNGSNKQPLFRSEMLSRDRGTTAQGKVTSPTSLSAFSSLSSEGRSSAPNVPPARSTDSFISAMPIKPGRSPNWSDAETRFLIGFWAEQHQNISQQRNAKAWDIVARLLNQKLAQCGFETFRTGQQCKGRMKSIVFDYRTTKKRLIETGEDDRKCDYFEELDQVLGKVQGGGSELSDPSTVTQEGEKASAGGGDNEDSSTSDDIVVVNIPTSSALNVDTTTGLQTGITGVEVNQTVAEERESPQRKEPPRKRKKKTPTDDDDNSTIQFLRSYMEESDRRDREFLLQMAQMDREREERNYERTMKMMMEMAKVFKSSIASNQESPRGSGVGTVPPTHGGDMRLSMSDNNAASSRVGESFGTHLNRDSRMKGNEGGSAQDKKEKPLQFLKEYMEESDRRDREFLLQMTRMDREREERSSEQTMRLMMEVAKVFRGGS